MSESKFTQEEIYSRHRTDAQNLEKAKSSVSRRKAKEILEKNLQSAKRAGDIRKNTNLYDEASRAYQIEIIPKIHGAVDVEEYDKAMRLIDDLKNHKRGVRILDHSFAARGERKEEKVDKRGFIVIDRKTFQRIPWGKEERYGKEMPLWRADIKRCHNCAAFPGDFHNASEHKGEISFCDMEECPKCHNQIMTCDCTKSKLSRIS